MCCCHRHCPQKKNTHTPPSPFLLLSVFSPALSCPKQPLSLHNIKRMLKSEIWGTESSTVVLMLSRWPVAALLWPGIRQQGCSSWSMTTGLEQQWHLQVDTGGPHACTKQHRRINSASNSPQWHHSNLQMCKNVGELPGPHHEVMLQKSHDGVVRNTNKLNICDDSLFSQ